MISILTPEKDIIALTSPVGAGNSISNTNHIPGISSFVSSQFPQFVAEDHLAFIEFIEAYYGWLDSKGNPLYEARKLLDNQDIDTVSDEYEEHLFNEFLSILPKNMVADRSIILKNIKQFYGAKGTEKSFKFLFRILFNSDSYLYYPRVDILKTSDGKWIQNKTIRITDTNGDIRKIRAQRVVGATSNTTAFVERFYSTKFTGVAAYELILNSSSITGSFVPGENIICQYIEDEKTITVTGKISPVVTGVRIIRPGSGYSVGDSLSVDGLGTGAIIRVSEVNTVGGIVKCIIKEYGIGYSVDSPPTGIRFINAAHPEIDQDIQASNDTVAIVNLTLGATTNYPGYFRNLDGQVSADKNIHDGHYYQQFSYVTYTDRPYSEYRDVVNKVVHPLGFKHFGGVSLVMSAKIGVKQVNYDTPITMELVSIIPAAVSGQAHITSLYELASKNTLGPSHASIMRDKFTYKPFIKYNANTEMIDQEPPYYGTHTKTLSSTPVSTFQIQNIGIDSPRSIEINKIKKTRIMPDAFIIQNPERVVVSTAHEITKNIITVVLGSEDAIISFNVKNDTDGPFQWTIKKNGIQIDTGTSSASNINIITQQNTAESCRVSLFVVDNLGRLYKSNNVALNVVE